MKREKLKQQEGLEKGNAGSRQVHEVVKFEGLPDDILDKLAADAKRYKTLISLGQPHPEVDCLSEEGLLKAIYIPALIAEVRQLREQVLKNYK